MSELQIALDGDPDSSTVVITHGGEDALRAAVLDDAGTVTAVVLVPADWEEQDPATRYQPDGEVVLLDDHEAPQVGATWHAERGWIAPELPEQPEPEPVAPNGETLRRDVDAVLALLLSAQAGGAEPTEHDWPAILGGLVERGTAGATEITGAVAWRLLDDAQADDLHNRLP